MKIRTLILLPILSLIFSQDPCTCEDDFNPVCGMDGFTYPNECIAICFGTTVDYTGECTTQNQCGPGEFLDTLTDECMTCEPGYYSMGGLPACEQCPGGTESNGMQGCDDWGYPDMECGADSCMDCSPGYWSTSGSNQCMSCEPGYYSMGGLPGCEQ